MRLIAADQTTRYTGSFDFADGMVYLIVPENLGCGRRVPGLLAFFTFQSLSK